LKATITKVEKRITVKERRAEGILSYDIDNLYPERSRDIVSNSTIAKTCVTTYRKYIFGKGFANLEFANTKLNRWNDTSDKILSLLSENFAYHGGFCLHVNYNADYKITDISFQPLSHVRFTLPESENAGMYAVCKDWTARVSSKNKITYIDKFTTDPVIIQEQVEKSGGWSSYKGQILYISNNEDQYPLPIYDAALEDMQTDAQTKTYKFRNITTNFMASHILFTDKMESNNSENESNEKNTFIESLREFQGSDEAGKIMHVEKDSHDQTFDLKKVDQQNGDTLFQWTENSVRENIRQAFLIPPVLLQATAGKLGQASEIIDANKQYNSITEDERILIEEVFAGLAYFYVRPLGDDFSIEPRSSIRKEDIPTEIYPDLTKNERRSIAGFPEITEGDAKTLAEKLQVGGTTAFIAVVNDTTMTPEQKRGTLKVLFNLNDEQIKTIFPNADIA